MKKLLKRFGDWFYELALAVEAHGYMMGELEEQADELVECADWADWSKACSI